MMQSRGVISYPAGNPLGNFERTDSFSVELWFYQTTMKSGSLVGHMGPSPLLRGWLCQSWTGRNLGLSLCSDNGGPNYLNVRTASSIFPFNTWTHAVFTYNGTSLPTGVKIYVNGTSRTLSTVGNSLTGTILNSEPVWIGYSHPYGGFPGRIDEVVIYDRVLAAAEVTQRYNAGVGTETLFGTAYLQYHLNESSGTVVPDSSGNLRHGVTVGSPSWIAGKINNCLQLNGSSQYVQA